MLQPIYFYTTNIHIMLHRSFKVQRQLWLNKELANMNKSATTNREENGI